MKKNLSDHGSDQALKYGDDDDNFDDEDIDQDEKTMRKMAITSQLAVLDRSLRSTIGKKLLVQLSLYYISLSYQPLVINIALYTNISLGKHFSSESRTFSLV